MIVLSIVLMALVTYLPRFLGLSLASFSLPPFWLRFLAFVPVAVFAALIVPALPHAGETGIRIIAAVAASLTL